MVPHCGANAVHVVHFFAVDQESEVKRAQRDTGVDIVPSFIALGDGVPFDVRAVNFDNRPHDGLAISADDVPFQGRDLSH